MIFYINYVAWWSVMNNDFWSVAVKTCIFLKFAFNYS